MHLDFCTLPQSPVLKHRSPLLLWHKCACSQLWGVWTGWEHPPGRLHLETLGRVGMKRESCRMWVGVRLLVSDKAKIMVWRKNTHHKISCSIRPPPVSLRQYNLFSLFSHPLLDWPSLWFPPSHSTADFIFSFAKLDIFSYFYHLISYFYSRNRCVQVSDHPTWNNTFKLFIRLYCQVLAKSLRPLCCSGACPLWLTAQILPLVLWNCFYPVPSLKKGGVGP